MPAAYYNGHWIDDTRLAIPVGDLGFAMGVTVTERLRTFRGKVFRQAEHTARMRRSLQIIGLDQAIASELDDAICEFTERNQDHRRPDHDWAVVAFATPGVDGRPTRCVHGFPLPFAQWAHAYESGVRVVVSQHRQTPANCWPAELKCRSRMHYYLADQQARAAEPDARALLLDQDGHVGEASTANIVLYQAGQGLLAPKMHKVLPGVSVAVVQELAARLGLPFTECDLTVDQLKAADEVWLCSTSVCMLPVVRCDGHAVGGGRPGPCYQRLLAAWGEMVGVDIPAQAKSHA